MIIHAGMKERGWAAISDLHPGVNLAKAMPDRVLRLGMSRQKNVLRLALITPDERILSPPIACARSHRASCRTLIFRRQAKET